MCEVLNQMFLQGMVTLGETVCIPKQAEARQMEDFRPITLLNTDYKLFARIMADRLRSRVEHLKTTQYCGVPGNAILGAVSTIRDVIIFAESTETPVCVLSLDFAQAFDRISHQHLFQTLQAYGIGSWFVERIKALYTNAMTSIRIQGLNVGRIPVRSAIQGCPLSMILFALCIQPLLSNMEVCLAGVTGRRGKNHGGGIGG
jgi:hypothetical protein